MTADSGSTHEGDATRFLNPGPPSPPPPQPISPPPRPLDS
ncbi:hypothetical protein L3Q82_004694 [Scortum barcoo]|uniref:Uncharacterized protein n=1 Tax=Scortum barcoo TaxID=214431 RepID=A0ACB8VGU8_9TELE|nr:hypothetical protein L3Q82_004694 [Scortum barcoo]